MKRYLEPLKGVEKSPRIGGFIFSALIIGALGTVLGGCWLAPIAWAKVKKAIVFAAAPTNLILIGPENVVWVKENAPPPYIKSASEKTQLLQIVPSTKKSPLACKLKFSKVCDGGKTTGAFSASPMITNPGPDIGGPEVGACAKIDVWLPNSMRNSSTLQAPTINDPNASVILDILPPSTDEPANCSVWHYHYGEVVPRL